MTGPVELSECMHCGGFTLNAPSDECRCGGELYPISRTIQPGTRIMLADGSMHVDRAPLEPGHCDYGTTESTCEQCGKVCVRRSAAAKVPMGTANP
jgi:hypothetical protein